MNERVGQNNRVGRKFPQILSILSSKILNVPEENWHLKPL